MVQRKLSHIYKKLIVILLEKRQRLVLPWTDFLFHVEMNIITLQLFNCIHLTIFTLKEMILPTLHVNGVSPQQVSECISLPTRPFTC